MADRHAEHDTAVPAARTRRSGSNQARVAIVLVIAGVLAMLVPGLLRDGVCGLVACADVTPDVAVGKPTGTDLAVVIPEKAAKELRSLRLFPVTAQAQQDTAGSWIIYRTSDDAAPTTIPLGEQPEGFDTRIALEKQPSSGLWVLEASFGCSSTLVRFSPQELDPGLVTAGVQPESIDHFLANADASLRCSTEAPWWQRWLFGLGALSACAGAILGIVVVLRRPVPDDPDWYGP